MLDKAAAIERHNRSAVRLGNRWRGVGEPAAFVCNKVIEPEISEAMNRVFISYRRKDISAKAIVKIIGRMCQDVGFEKVFVDVDEDAIPVGENYRVVIDSAIDSAHLMLALIGAQWISLMRRRGFDPNDPVRREIERGLSSGKRLIPVLIDGASMPREDDLPQSIRQLHCLNAFHLDTYYLQKNSAPFLAKLARADLRSSVEIQPFREDASAVHATKGVEAKAPEDIVAQLENQEIEKPNAPGILDDLWAPILEAETKAVAAAKEAAAAAKVQERRKEDWLKDWNEFKRLRDHRSAIPMVVQTAWDRLLAKWHPVLEEDATKPRNWEATLDRDSEWTSDGLSLVRKDRRHCPNGHGPLREWDGRMRCWTCGWHRKE